MSWDAEGALQTAKECKTSIFFYRKSSVVKQPSTPFASGAVHARIRPGHNDGFLKREKITCNAQIESKKTQPPAGLEPATVRLRAVRSTD